MADIIGLIGLAAVGLLGFTLVMLPFNIPTKGFLRKAGLAVGFVVGIFLATIAGAGMQLTLGKWTAPKTADNVVYIGGKRVSPDGEATGGATSPPSGEQQASQPAPQNEPSSQQLAAEARREAVVARQHVQRHWGEVLSRLGTAYGTSAGTLYLKNPNPVAVINMLRVSSGMAEEACQAAENAFMGEGYLGSEWQPVFDELRVAGARLVEANQAYEDGIGAGSASMVADSQPMYEECGDRVNTAIRDGRAIYKAMGGDPKALPAYGFKP